MSFVTETLYKLILMIFYLLTTIPIFNAVYETSQEIIDEEFHLRQGLHYCNGNFSVWDPKITTFPGLYLASTAIFYPFNACTVYNLRLTSLIASVINIFLIFGIRNRHESNRQSYSAYTAIETLTISLLPPLYFFSNLYYTDVLSVTTVLGMVYFSSNDQHTIGSIFGAFSVMMRQTNIIWVAMFFGYTALNSIMLKCLPLVSPKRVSHHLAVHYHIGDILLVVKFHLTRFDLMINTIKMILREFYGYLIVMVGFVAFLVINGGIVVGDKTAHVAAIHLPQIFYFSLFFTFFGISTTLSNFGTVLRILVRRWWISLPAILLILATVHFNTIVHPYLLADNRHYIFYIWNRLSRHELSKYLFAPVYLFGLANIWVTLRSKSTAFILFYIVCGVASVALQQLLEVRYFILPFLLLRLMKYKPKMKFLLCEFFGYLVLNALTLYVFFNKEIRWSDYQHIQRMIW